MILFVVVWVCNGVIGCDNDILWYLFEDLCSFQCEMLGSVVVMGCCIWDSLFVKLLKNCMNIVVSCDVGLVEYVVVSVVDVIVMVQVVGYICINGIGGQVIYCEMLLLVDWLLVIEVDLDIFDVDVFFLVFDEGDWKELICRILLGDGLGCVLCELICC